MPAAQHNLPAAQHKPWLIYPNSNRSTVCRHDQILNTESAIPRNEADLISIREIRGVIQDTATRVRYKGQRYTANPCLGVRSQRTIQNRAKVGTQNSREMNVGSHVSNAGATAITSRRGGGNAVAPWGSGAERLTKRMVAVK